MTLDILVSGAGNTIINGVEMSFAGKDTSGQEVWESPDGGYYYGNGTYLGTTFNPATGGMSGSGNASGSLNGSGGGLSGSGTGNGSGSTAADTTSGSSGNPAGGNAGSQQGESNPFEVTPEDVAGGAYSAFTTTLGYCASKVEESATTYRYAVDIPLAAPLIMIDAGLAYQQNGPGAALSALLGDTAGYIATSAFMDFFAEGLIGAAAVVGFPEVAVTAGVALFAVGVGMAVSKGVQYLVNNLENQTPVQNSSGQTVYPDGTTVSTLANGDTQYALSNGTTYTVDPGTGTSTISVNGDTYSFDAANNVTGVSLNNNSLNMQVAANGAATVTDATGAVSNVSFGTDANGNPTATATNSQGQSSSMTLSTDSNGNAVATSGDISSTTLVDPDTGNLTTTVTQGGQTVEQVQYGADGSAAQSFYDPTTGALIRQNQIAPDGSQVNDVVNADGSQTITALNAAGQKTEQDQVNADGSRVVDFYNPSTGALTGENQIAADGSQTDYTINGDGSQTATVLNADDQKTEQVQFNTDGSQVQDYYNPGTGALTGEKQINADGSQTDTVMNADGSQTAAVYDAVAGHGNHAACIRWRTLVDDEPSTGQAIPETDLSADIAAFAFDFFRSRPFKCVPASSQLSAAIALWPCHC